MIIDTSAAVAIINEEPDASVFAEALSRADNTRIGFEVLDINAEHLYEAIRAQERFGRGSGSPARLNFGDCFSYAAAKMTGEPLLFKGDDFTHTDIRSALP